MFVLGPKRFNELVGRAPAPSLDDFIQNLQSNDWPEATSERRVTMSWTTRSAGTFQSDHQLVAIKWTNWRWLDVINEPWPRPSRVFDLFKWLLLWSMAGLLFFWSSQAVRWSEFLAAKLLKTDWWRQQRCCFLIGRRPEVPQWGVFHLKFSLFRMNFVTN